MTHHLFTQITSLMINGAVLGLVIALLGLYIIHAYRRCKTLDWVIAGILSMWIAVPVIVIVCILALDGQLANLEMALTLILEIGVVSFIWRLLVQTRWR